MLRSSVAPCAAALFVAAVSLDSSAAVVGHQQTSAFGFEIGEERRYLLGPPEALDPGEGAVWSMRLEMLRDNGEAVFVLAHHRTGPQGDGYEPAIGEELEARFEGELTVNPHGFPVRLEFDVLRSFVGFADDSYHVRYTFDGRNWIKRVTTFDKQWDIAIPISGHRNLDRSVPIGLYVLLANAYDCVGYRPSVVRVRRTQPPQLTPGQPLTPVPPPDLERWARVCEADTDLGFLNPGLLSIAWPAILETGERREDFLFFTPTGADLFPGAKIGAGGVAVGGWRRPGQEGGIDVARDQRRYYVASTIELGEVTRIRVRGRGFDAIAAEMRHHAGTVYFDEDGKVLLLEIDPPDLFDTDILNLRGAVTSLDPEGLERRFIRLMFPSEY